jgi:hypothetical protein
VRVEAFSLDGRPLSLVIDEAGRLFLGDVDEELYGCPCEPRS